MKKIFLPLFLIMIAASACSKKQEAVAVKDPTPDEVADQISQAICKRAVECLPESQINETQCTTETKTSLTQLLTEKQVKLVRQELDTCLNQIRTGPCEEVMSQEGPPKGCEKLQ